MARKYDVESMVQDIETLLKANLNAYVAAVEAEQVAAGLPAASPVALDTDAYFQFAWNDKALNKQVGVGIFIASDNATQAEGAYASRRYLLDVGVYLSGTSNDATATRKLLRYAKALEQLFTDKWGKVFQSQVSREKIETVGPIDFKFNVDSADDCKIAGVTLTVTLG